MNDDLTVRVRELATGKMRRLAKTASAIVDTIFSPDGRQIAFGGRSTALQIIGLEDGAKPRTLYQNQEMAIFPADWSRDGKNILAGVIRKDGTGQIALVSVADGSARLLKSFSWGYPGGLSLSPDGRYIAYEDLDDGSRNNDIFLLAADGSREIPLVKHPANDSVLGWMPDGRFVFRSNRKGTGDIWVMKIAAGKPQGAPKLVTSDVPGFRAFTVGFTRDGSYYYGHSPRPASLDVYITTLDVQKGKVINPPARVSQRVGPTKAPAWSPDGRYLAYVSVRQNVLCIRSLENGKERKLRLEKIGGLAWLRWSPDGRSLLTRAYNKKRGDTFRIDPQTGDSTALSGAWHGQWSPDGKAVFHTTEEPAIAPKSFSIVKRNVETGRPTELYRARFHFRLGLVAGWSAVGLSLATEDPLRHAHRRRKAPRIAPTRSRGILRLVSGKFTACMDTGWTALALLWRDRRTPSARGKEQSWRARSRVVANLLGRRGTPKAQAGNGSNA